jgi:competence protein ComEC
VVRRVGTVRVTRAVVAAGLPVVLVAAMAGPCGRRPDWPGTDWLVVVCDVGQGESVLVRAGPTSAVVIDTGPESGPVVSCLRAAGVRSVPLLVLTHFHADHVGGLAGILAARPVGHVWHSPALDPAANADEVAGLLASAGVRSSVPREGQEATVGAVRARVLWPDRVLDPHGAAAGEGTAINDASLVLRVEVGGMVLLALGDVETSAQTALVRGDPSALDADMVMIAHHGSSSQVPDLYEKASAMLAVASAGVDNPYGHPSPRTTAMVAATGARVLVTADGGGVAVSDGGEGSLRVIRQR